MFTALRLKVERAYKHIGDLNELVDGFVKADFYSISVITEADGLINNLWFEIDESGFPFNGSALVLGDALHNLKSSLDILFNEIVAPPSKAVRPRTKSYTIAGGAKCHDSVGACERPET
jgi:hypothetical protein